MADDLATATAVAAASCRSKTGGPLQFPVPKYVCSYLQLNQLAFAADIFNSSDIEQVRCCGGYVEACRTETKAPCRTSGVMAADCGQAFSNREARNFARKTTARGLRRPALTGQATHKSMTQIKEALPTRTAEQRPTTCLASARMLALFHTRPSPSKEMQAVERVQTASIGR